MHTHGSETLKQMRLPCCIKKQYLFFLMGQTIQKGVCIAGTLMWVSGTDVKDADMPKRKCNACGATDNLHYAYPLPPTMAELWEGWLLCTPHKELYDNKKWSELDKLVNPKRKK